MLANCNPTPCVNRCRVVFIGFGFTNKKDHTRNNWLLPCWCVLIVLKHCTLCSNQSAASPTFISVKTYVPLSMKKLSNMATGNRACWTETKSYTRKRICCYRIMAAWVVESVQDNEKHRKILLTYRCSLTEYQHKKGLENGKCLVKSKGIMMYPETSEPVFLTFTKPQEHLSQPEWYIGELKKTLCGEKILLSQYRKLLISSLALRNSALISFLSFFLSRKCSRLHKNTPFRCLHSEKVFQHLCIVDSGCKKQFDQNQNSSVIAVRLKLLVNSSFGQQPKNWDKKLPR